MVILGVLSLAYGLLFMQVRMFAGFNPELATVLGVVTVVSGVVLLVVTRRRLRAETVAEATPR